MSYFDHVKCPSCGAQFDPEKVVHGPGKPLACPYCHDELGVANLFGVRDAFSENDEPNLTLDDLSPRDSNTPVWTAKGGYAPDPMADDPDIMAQRAAAAKKQPWDKGRGQIVKKGSSEGGSALDMMKQIKDKG